MNKKILLIIVLAFICIMGVYSVSHSRENFDGIFEMDVPHGQHFEDKASCLPNGKLGCIKEYWEVDSGCQMDEGDIVVFYYDDSYLVDGESNSWEHSINTLTGTYFYKNPKYVGKLLILTNDLGSTSMPPYIVGVHNDDGNKVVFVGGYHLEDLMKYANSVEFK